MAKGRKEKFDTPSSKRVLRLPDYLWNRLDAIAEEQGNGRIAQDLIYEKLLDIKYACKGNFDDLLKDVQTIVKKHKLKE